MVKEALEFAAFDEIYEKRVVAVKALENYVRLSLIFTPIEPASNVSVT